MVRNRRLAFSLLVMAWLIWPVAAVANTLQFEANLDGLQEVPPNASPAFGLADVTLDDSTGLLTVTTGSFNGLLGGSLAVTVNDAPAGSSAASIFALTLDTPGATTGTFSGSGTLSPTQITDIEAGNLYVNILSQVFPSGEIRGQFFTVPEPSSILMWAAAALGLFIAGWPRS